MRTLAVMAHYDPSAHVGPHAARNAAALADAADRVVIVSTAGLSAEAAAPLRANGEVIARENHGYDFYSWKVGLASVEDLGSYDTVVICNDSYVGPLVPYASILEAMARERADFWGLSASERIAPHVQSFFLAFRRRVVRSRTFRQFWIGMTSASDRSRVIHRYEVGLSRALVDSGFSFSAYFRESAEDRRVARLRHLWRANRHARLLGREGRRAARALRWEPWNPASALADRCLHGARLPVVKIDVLRYDPYQLGADRLLGLCEQSYPRAFAGVRPYLRRTAHLYPPREFELGPRDVPRPLRSTLGYHA